MYRLAQAFILVMVSIVCILVTKEVLCCGRAQYWKKRYLFLLHSVAAVFCILFTESPLEKRNTVQKYFNITFTFCFLTIQKDTTNSEF